MKKEMCESDSGECCHGHCGKIAMILGLVLLAGILAVGAFTAGSMNANSSIDQKVLNVSGSVTKFVTPDKVEIVLAVDTLDKLAQASQSNNANISDAVRAALKKAGVQDSEIKTVSYSVNEEFDWNKETGESMSKGYRTSNSIQVTLTDIKKAGAVVDAAVNAGANKVSGITFGLTAAKELEIRTAALSEASATAKAKADSMASGLGVSVGKVKSVSENQFYYTPNYANYDMAKASGVSNAPTPITAGDVQVDASVAVTYELN
jgi:uncharacterized protein YggE